MSEFTGVSVDVRGMAEVQKALGQLTGPDMKKVLQKASTAGAKAFKKPVQAAAPRDTGRLRKSVSARQARKDRPAAVVSARPKIAFYRHMVIGGTQAHGPQSAKLLIFKAANGQGNVYTQRVKGTPSRPFISVGYQRGKAAADMAIDKVINDYLASL